MHAAGLQCVQRVGDERLVGDRQQRGREASRVEREQVLAGAARHHQHRLVLEHGVRGAALDLGNYLVAHASDRTTQPAAERSCIG